MVVLALDLGGKRTGVAVNPTGAVVLELPTLSSEARSPFLADIKRLVGEYGAGTILVGLPRDPSQALEELLGDLKQHLPGVAVETVNETLSTKEAERQLAAEGVPPERRDTDARAAKILLEQYLAGQDG